MKRATGILLLAASAGWAVEAAAGPIGWSGFHASLSAGYSHASGDINYAHQPDSCGNNSFGSDAGGGCGGAQDYSTVYPQDDSTFIAGAAGGYDWAAGSFVVGLEATLDLRDATTGHAVEALGYFGDRVEVRTEQGSLASLRGRVGLPWRDLLFYATAGLAAGDVTTWVDQRVEGGANGRSFEESSTEVGYLAGAGLNYRLGRHWLVGAEYLYTDLGNQAVSAPVAVDPSTIILPATQVSTETTSSILKARVTWMF